MDHLWLLLIGGKEGGRVERLRLHVACRHTLPQQNMRYIYSSNSHLSNVAVTVGILRREFILSTLLNSLVARQVVLPNLSVETHNIREEVTVQHQNGQSF